eukprot:jgi/Tetstr1/425235/TSEL_001519.t1
MGAFEGLPASARKAVHEADMYRSSFSPKQARMSPCGQDIPRQPAFNLLVAAEELKRDQDIEEYSCPSTPITLASRRLPQVPDAPRKPGLRRSFHVEPIPFRLSF